MALEISKAEVWAAGIEDRAGGLADKLQPLSDAGANLEFMIARRDQPGTGVVFVTPVKGSKVVKAAQGAGFAKSDSIHSLRIEGGDKPGTITRAARALSDAGISFRGLSAAAIGRKFVAHVALDSAEDAKKAAAILKKLG
jgi:hypothetical protein